MIDATLKLGSETLLLDLTGALFLAAHDTLVVSDLHFEKGSSFVRQGLTLPPYDTRTTLRNLQEVCARRTPARVIALGDSFHDKSARARIDPEDAALIRKLTTTHQWTWITGNHDPVPPADLGGGVAVEINLGSLTLRHQPHEGHAPGEIAGHLHPCAAVHAKGRRLRRKCFASDGARLILPAFGAFTGGLNVLDPAYETIFPGDFHAWMIGRDRVYPMARARLVPNVRSNGLTG